jgi:hypothetical protein
MANVKHNWIRPALITFGVVLFGFGLLGWVSQSIAEAKSNGIFVHPVYIRPQEVDWRGEPIRFKEAWIEEISRLEHPALLFTRRKRLGEYRLCFTLHTYGPFLREVPGERMPFFVREGAGSSFGEQGRSGDSIVFYLEIENQRPNPFKVSLINDWHAEREINIVVSVATPN